MNDQSYLITNQEQQNYAGQSSNSDPNPSEQYESLYRPKSLEDSEDLNQKKADLDDKHKGVAEFMKKEVRFYQKATNREIEALIEWVAYQFSSLYSYRNIKIDKKKDFSYWYPKFSETFTKIMEYLYREDTGMLHLLNFKRHLLILSSNIFLTNQEVLKMHRLVKFWIKTRSDLKEMEQEMQENRSKISILFPIL